MALPQHMINATDTVTLCIGGRIFVTRRATLYRLPDSRLFMAASKNDERFSSSKQARQADPGSPNGSFNGNPQQKVIFFDRDPEIFRFVLDYYRTGDLHLPSNICGPFVRKELIFWGIDESLIGACCMPAYMRYDEEKRTKATLFKDCFEDIDSIKSLVKCSRGLKRLRYRIWLFLDHPSSSFVAKIWSSILLSLMITSFMCFCLGTHEDFRRPTTKVLNYNNSSICNLSSMNNPKFRKDCTTEPLTLLVILDVILNIIFTLEFLFKFLLAPYKRKFLRTSVALLDIVILSSYWVYMSIFYFYYYYDDSLHDGDFHDGGTLWVLNIMSMTQSFRILRIFKISKISRGLRVLMLTIKKSIPELVLLGFLLMNGMFLFSSLIYLAEYRVANSFPDIPKAFWWSIVTLTTVGYGDSYPKGGFGYLIGSMTAICGCVVTGLAIPIIGNNFNTYYMYMKNQIKEDKYRKENDQNGGSGFSKTDKVKNHMMLHKKIRRFANKPLSSLSTNFKQKSTMVNANKAPIINSNKLSEPVKIDSPIEPSINLDCTKDLPSSISAIESSNLTKSRSNLSEQESSVIIELIDRRNDYV